MSDLLHQVFVQQKSTAAEMLTDNSYQKYNDHWTGKVIDNNDILCMGRVKIRIVGYYDEIADDALPWALPETSYLGSTKGNLVVPEVGTMVRGYFDNGDDQKPIYNAIAPSVKNYSEEVHTIRMDELIDYPNIMVLLTTNEGERLTLNRSTGEVKFVQRAGTTLIINSDGSIKIEKTIPLSVGGAVNTKSDGLDVSIAGDINVNAIAANVKIKSTFGNITVNASGGAVNLGNNACDIEDPETGETTPSPTKHLVNNFTNCLFTGAPHCSPDSLPKNLNVYV